MQYGRGAPTSQGRLADSRRGGAWMRPFLGVSRRNQCRPHLTSAQTRRECTFLSPEAVPAPGTWQPQKEDPEQVFQLPRPLHSASSASVDAGSHVPRGASPALAGHTGTLESDRLAGRPSPLGLRQPPAQLRLFTDANALPSDRFLLLAATPSQPLSLPTPSSWGRATWTSSLPGSSLHLLLHCPQSEHPVLSQQSSHQGNKFNQLRWVHYLCSPPTPANREGSWGRAHRVKEPPERKDPGRHHDSHAAT